MVRKRSWVQTPETAYLKNNYFIKKFKHFKYNYYGENIASSPLGTIDVIAVGRYNKPNDAHRNKLTYYAKNGYQLADNINNALIYHDAGDNWGHRHNILNFSSGYFYLNYVTII
ncbi:MAG: Hypothetical protein AJITA_01279 [Acetilactobacillus jinshanensis]